MSAITFRFGVEEDVSDSDSAVAALEPEAAIIAEAEPDAQTLDAEVTSDGINVSHAGLEAMAWLRGSVAEALAGIPFRVEFRGRDVKLAREAFPESGGLGGKRRARKRRK